MARLLPWRSSPRALRSALPSSLAAAFPQLGSAQFGAHLPELSSSVYQDHLLPTDIELISVKTLMYTSTIHLHRDMLTMHPLSYQRCVAAANSITAMTQELNEHDYAFLNPIISVRAALFACRSAAETRCRLAGRARRRSTSRCSRAG